MYENGALHCISPEGKEVWGLSLPFTPKAFRINATGDLLAVLGRGGLIYCDLLTRKTKKFDLSKEFQMLDLYRNSAVMGGFQRDITFVRPNGSTLKTISFEHLIRQFKVISCTDSLLVYDQNSNLVCTDMDGNVRWRVESLIIHSEIIVSETGHRGYFVIDPHDLIQFDVRGETFLEMDNEGPLKCFSTSADGKVLLAIDFKNTLMMLDQNANKIWDHHVEHAVQEIKISPRGTFFFVVDYNHILTCYSNDTENKERGAFFEFQEEKRVFDRERTWTKRPGAHHPIGQMGMLSVNGTGIGLGLIGQDRAIHFYDEQGTDHFSTTFPAMVDTIGMSDSFDAGHVYGEGELVIFDFRKDRKQHILFDSPFLGKPVINYALQRIFLIANEKELLIHDFEGRLLSAAPLKEDYEEGIACASHGVVLLGSQSVTGFSGEGKTIFTFPLSDRVSDVCYTEHTLICITKERSLLALDLSSQRAKKRAFKGKTGDIRIVSADPLFIVSEEERLYHLDKAISPISQYPIQSPDSLFFMDGAVFYEILRGRNQFLCYNRDGNMVWRHYSREGIRESALMRNGLVFITRESLQYTGIRSKAPSQEHFSKFLEF